MDSDLNFTEKVNQEKTKVPTRAKYPKLILENIFAFAPNRDTLGGTSYLLIHPLGNILVDCPFWSEENKDFCLSHGVKYLFVTNRDGISKHISHIKKELHCELVIQEQEAYLLPNLVPLHSQKNIVFMMTVLVYGLVVIAPLLLVYIMVIMEEFYFLVVIYYLLAMIKFLLSN